MRKSTSRVLLGAGAFALSLAGLTAAVIAPSLLKAPLVNSITQEASGPAQRIDATTGRLVDGTFSQYRALGTKVCQQKWCGVGSPMGDDDTAVYQSYSEGTFVPTGSDEKIDVTKLIVTQAFDRSTGEGRPEFRGDATRSEAHVFKLPFGTEKKTYQLYDGQTRKAFPLTYKGEKTVRGLDVYEFQQVVPPTNTGPVPVVRAIPGAWVGEPSTPAVLADQYVEDTDKRVWVEPVTGRIVGGSSNTHVWAQTSDGRTVDLLRLAGVTQTDESLASLVADTEEARSSALLVRRAPWVLGLLGLLLLGLGILGVRRSGTSAGTTDEIDEGADSGLTGVLPGARDETPLDTDTRY